MIGRRPESTLGTRETVIRMLTAVTMNKQITRHFQACECTISSLRTKIRRTGSVDNRKPYQQITLPPGERTLPW